jgi:hypothetical protein
VTPRKARPFAVVAVVCAVLALCVTTAIAAETSPKAATVFHACLKDGTLSSVATKAVTCASGFKAVSWDKTGPTGPMGPSNSFYAADSTAQQLQTTLSPVLSMSLGAGTYVVNADVWLDDESPSNASDLAICELTLGTATDEVEVGLSGPSSAPQNEGTLSMTVAATIASAGSATVSCVGAGNTGETLANTVNMTGIQSSSLTTS